MFNTYYQNLARQNPNQDPAITDHQSIDNKGHGTVFNPVSKKSLVLSQTGALSLYNNSSETIEWSTPAGPHSNTYSAKFDSSFNNNGNFCVFESGESDPIWCILPQITVTTSLNNQPGDLASIQNNQLAAGNMKNSYDARPRFAMVDDSGQFCVYKGAPGSGQTTQIICK
jgi:hypothetical protein